MLISTAGLHLKDEEPFKQSFKDSDCSWRALPAEASADQIRISHISGDFERAGAEQDLNLVYPIDRLRELVAGGSLDSICDTNFSFMGSLPNTEELTRVYAPQVAAQAVKKAVDIAILVPV